MNGEAKRRIYPIKKSGIKIHSRKASATISKREMDDEGYSGENMSSLESEEA